MGLKVSAWDQRGRECVPGKSLTLNLSHAKQDHRRSQPDTGTVKTKPETHSELPEEPRNGNGRWLPCPARPPLATRALKNLGRGSCNQGPEFQLYLVLIKWTHVATGCQIQQQTYHTARRRAVNKCYYR